MEKNAGQYLEQGRQMLQADKLREALEFFTLAIEIDPHHSEAYRNRSAVFSRLGHTDEAAADTRMAQALNSSGIPRRDKQKRPENVQKIDLNNVDSIYDDLTQDGEDDIDFDTNLFDYAFSDDILESDAILQSPANPQTKKTGFATILEYLNGRREEVPWTHLFEPSKDQLTLIRDEGAEPGIISLEQLSSIRSTRAPTGFARNKDEACHVEIIETIDGNIYYEAIHPLQNRDNVLYGFSTKKETRFKYTFIPLQNIKKRYQRRHLGQILLDKKLLTGDVLQHALDEHNELKKIKFGRIIAERAKILYSAVESEIQRAYENPLQKLKVGEILLKAGLVSEEQVLEALAYQKKLHNKKLGNFLIEKGILQEKEVYMALAEKFRIPFVDLRQQKGSRKILSQLPRELIEKLKILPLSANDSTMVIATLMPDPSPICELILKYSPLKNVEFVLAQPSHLRNVIKILFQQKK
ncbi:MAG: hypothetical protein M8357_02125 [Desulfobulbaceae bacterium]|nr:hypothetical protein [Desulfobulbaceae bacterium]